MKKVSNKAFKATQKGMSLVEMGVSLLAMAAVAGVAVPYAGNMITKVKNTTSGVSGKELLTDLTGYVAQKNSMPNNLESLLAGTSNTASITLDDNVLDSKRVIAMTPGANPNSAATTPMWYQAGGYNYTTTPGNSTTVNPSIGSPNIANSLLTAGMVSVVNLPANGVYTATANGDFFYRDAATNTKDQNATNFPAQSPIALRSVSDGGAPDLNKWVTDTTGGSVCPKGSVSLGGATYTVAPSNYNIACALKIDPQTNHSFILLGIGAQNTSIGLTMQTAPVVKGDRATQNPSLVYSRYLAVVEVDSKNGVDPAKFVGVVHNNLSDTTVGGWESANDNLSAN